MSNPKNLATLLIAILVFLVVFAVYTQTFLFHKNGCNLSRKVLWPLQYEFKGGEFEQLFRPTKTENNSDKMCKQNTSLLVQRMRSTQQKINRVFRQILPSVEQRWERMPDLFGEAMNGFVYSLNVFKYNYSSDKINYFLEFADPRSVCTYIALGSKDLWDKGETLSLKYPQCQVIGMDKIDDQGGLREHGPFDSVNNDSNPTLLLLARQLKRESKGHLIDFMIIDLKSLELLRLLYKKRLELPVICQLNVGLNFRDSLESESAEDNLELKDTVGLKNAEDNLELKNADHILNKKLKPKNADHSLNENLELKNVDYILNALLDEAHFILLNVSEQGVESKRLFLFNVGDQECVDKFLC